MTEDQIAESRSYRKSRMIILRRVAALTIRFIRT
ncbi:hypothetical protein [Enterobacter phage N5822]|nr:hypothetical protein [Enterobacter phage N5822]